MTSMQSLPTNDELSGHHVDPGTVTVCQPGQPDRVLHSVDSSMTISQLKTSLGASAPEKARLIYGGSVLNDEDRLSDLALGKSPTLWLLSGASQNDQDLLSASRQLGIFAALGQLQSVDLPASISLLRGFCKSLTTQSSPWRPSKAEQDALSAAISTLESEWPAFHAVAHATWFSEYGCCLLASVPRVGVVQLRLVCLDEWRFRMQAGSDVRTHTADARGYVLDHVGEVSLSDYEDFLKRTSGLLEKRREVKRHHQYTPPMIKAVIMDALSNTLHPTNDPRGGFTDVGLHTGGQPRDTAWPLVQAVMQAVLDDADEFFFFRHAMAQLKLWIVEMMVLDYQSTRDCDGQKNQVDTDSCMHALSVAVLEGSSLADEQAHIRDSEHRKLDMDAFEARCVYARWQLEQARDTLSRAIADIYQLPLFSTPDLQCCNPELFPPKPTSPAQAEFNLSALRKKADVNLGALPSPSLKSISDLPEWLRTLKQSSSAKGSIRTDVALLCFETVERTFFQEAASLTESNALIDQSSAHYVQTIDDAVDSYRGVMSVFRDSSEAAALLSVERDSRELLVVWCAFCLVHKATLPFEFQVLKNFGVSLKPDDLQHLVLSEKLAINAAQAVVAYLRCYTKPGLHIFSLRPGDATFEMASTHARSSQNTISVWESEKEQAQKRRDEHWREVLKKKERLTILDQRLKEHKENLDTAEHSRSLYQKSNYKWHEYNAETVRYQELVCKTQSEIRETEIPPPAIFQPLPEVEEKALPIIFFLTMPKRFQVLSKLSFLAQQMLLPRIDQMTIQISGDPEVANMDILEKKIKEEPGQTSWRSYYLNGSTARYLSEAVVSAVRLESNGKVPAAKDFNPSNVRVFNSPTTGVWHPDNLCPRLTWIGGFQNFDHRKGACFNPFVELHKAVLATRFSELLPEHQRGMQWALVQKGALSEASRGNVPEARQDIKPSWLAGKTEFFAFGAMRAYPNQQVRKLCIALRERSLPLDDPAVRKLLQVTLFQLGELSDGMKPEPVWRTDLENHDGWAVLRSELNTLANELKLKPREHAAVLVLGELAAHASQWDRETRKVARLFANIAWAWASEDCETGPADKVAYLRARRSIFCMYVIICHGAGELDEDDVCMLCKASVVADHNRVFEDPSPLDQVVRDLTVVAHEVFARRLPELLDALDRDSTPLTSAVKAVLEALTPSHLDWKRVTSGGVQTACFEAVSSGPMPHLFSVNVQTGQLLYDGLPVGRLPQSILDHPLYKRTFSDGKTGNLANFEVVRSSLGIFETVRLQGGLKYEFFAHDSDELVVREVDPGRPTMTLELLDGTEEGVAAWGVQLPIRLRQMHSHWYCRTAHTIVLRERSYNGRNVQFMLLSSSKLTAHPYIKFDPPNSFVDSGWLCFRVPDHEAELNWVDLLPRISAFEQLVIPGESQMLRVLRKFETQPGCIHAYYAARSQRLIVELPRFDLSFELEQEGDHRGRFLSKNFTSFSLSESQQLPDTMYDFNQYLMLESCSGHQTLVIMPVGDVKGRPGTISIINSSSCTSYCRLHVFEVHPRLLMLQAKGGATAIEARFQLSALFAATSTALPETRSRFTGGEMALELLRQSWKGAPMTDDEQNQLSSIPKLSQSTPALPLLCHELHACSSELMCLQPGSSPVQVEYNADAATEYTQRKQSAQLNRRAQLTSEEEARVLGVRVSKRIRGDMPRVGTLQIPTHFSASKEIKQIESALMSMLVEKETSTMREAFPLTTADVDDNCLGRKTLSELEDSWSAHQLMPKVSLIMPIECFENELWAHHTRAQTLRDKVERHVLMHIDRIPCGAGWHASAFVMRRAANLVPRVTLSDLARAACDCESLRQFNPFLSREALYDVLRPAIFEWLELCVLEDKLNRMALIAAQGNAEELQRELQEVGREWNPQDHPEWLVFEVEQRLQIRKVQYRVAHYLMESPGAVTQLNMGEGKTRVILPMLLLGLAHGERLVRLHFPSALIDEAYFYLHETLTASLMRRQILRFPFHRDIKLTAEDVERMRDSLMRCMRACGAVCVAPEHKLSLQLKWHEIRAAGEQEELVESLRKLDEIPYLDLIDESDEVLHHKFQLIYAWGHNMKLPAGKERWCAVQATLRLLQTSPKVAAILRAPDVAKRIPACKLERPRAAVSSGAFDNLRLLPGPMLDSVREELVHVLATELMDDPPYEMRWLEKCDLRDTIIAFITKPKSSLAWFKEQAGSTLLNEVQRNQLLALRGLLAIGSIVHCCSRRHRVDYGVDERRGKSRRVAVPYRASNSPSERAEYAQPDTLIILTHLSYYHSGMSRDDLKEAASVMLSLGPAAQQATYDLWLKTARPGMSDAQVDALNNVSKLDVSSEVLLDHLYDVYRYNMEAINFWLDACVLPRETMQAPKRLAANSFNLTDNPRRDVIGFSGTKDNHLLLPLQVCQQTPGNVSELLGTDGKMCGLIIRNKDVVCLTDDVKSSFAVLNKVIEHCGDALIDAGAMMAGLNNEQVARYIVSKLTETSRLQGVVYFDTFQCTWVVLNRQGRIWLKSCSPIHEKDAFVYFDESRCRGADMKLRTDAKALLTIGPDMCKDKLVQAAGRMRKLDSGQTLIFFVPAELTPKICKKDNKTLTSLDLLLWVVQNTVKATAAGIPEYCSRASHFCMTKHPEARFTNDVLQLDELYGSSITEENVDAIVCRQVDRDVKRCSTLGIKSDAETFRMWHEIKLRARTYGSDLCIIVSGVEEECERELENERQLEREQERYVPKQKPVEPKQWDFSQLLTATKPADIADAGVMRLELAMKKYFDPVLSDIPWAKCNVYVTLAFIDTVRDSLGPRLTDNSEYMRPLDMVAVFPNSEVLLLSEWEADHLLPHMWQARPTDKRPFLVNLTYLREAADEKIPDASICLRVPAATASSMSPQLLIRAKPRVQEITLAGLQLLAGETMFATPERKDCIRDLTKLPVAKKAVIHLNLLRDRRHMLSRSDLELICNSDTDQA